MKLVVGLGNPGQEYENTRHNIGFRVIDALSQRWSIDVSRRKFSGISGSGWVRREQVLLLKPMTYMNLSGRAVREAMTFHKIDPASLLVITDDLALPLAKIRVRASGSAGGHNGLTSIIAEIGTQDFARLRVGIEWVAGGRMVRHVLGTFSPEELDRVNRAVGRAADAAECWLREGVAAAMNKYNRSDDQPGRAGTDESGGTAS